MVVARLRGRARVASNTEANMAKIMANIILGMGTSHGPMLSSPWKDWGLRVEVDR